MQKKLKINKQNFHGEVLSGRIIKLIKLTQENIRLSKQQTKEGKTYEQKRRENV